LVESRLHGQIQRDADPCYGTEQESAIKEESLCPLDTQLSAYLLDNEFPHLNIEFEKVKQKKLSY